MTIFIDTSGCFFLRTTFLTFCIKLSATLSFRSQSMSLDTTQVNWNGNCVLCTSQKHSSALFKTKLMDFIIHYIQLKHKLKCNEEECR